MDKDGMRVALSLPDVGISIVSLVSRSQVSLGLGLFLLQMWSQTSRINIIWEVVRNAESQAPAQTDSVRNCIVTRSWVIRAHS